MDIGELLDRAAIAARVSASSKRQALATAAEIAGRRLKLKPQAILDALMEREAQGSTGVGQGVAVPHARLEGLDRMRAVFLRLEQPIAFDAVDDRPVDLVCVLLAPKNAGVDHLRALAKVSRALRQGELREQLRQAHSADAIYALLAGDTRSNAA
ncbi:MAG TPA: PTS IIA-like nitrogen regulatory protein PtsN [Caulobacteraceae bacterium]|jgi:PTS system nitrogen regulatory IIA component